MPILKLLIPDITAYYLHKCYFYGIIAYLIRRDTHVEDQASIEQVSG